MRSEKHTHPQHFSVPHATGPEGLSSLRVRWVMKIETERHSKLLLIGNLQQHDLALLGSIQATYYMCILFIDGT